MSVTPPAASLPVPGSTHVTIFIPGIDPASPSRDLDGIAGRFRDALDREAATGAAKFSVTTRDVEYRPGEKIRSAEIQRSDGAASRPVLEIFMLDYAPKMTQRFERANLLLKALYLLSVLLGSGWTFLVGLFRRGAAGKTLRDRWRVTYLLGVLGLLVAYMIMLLAALWQIGCQAAAMRAARSDGGTVSATAPAAAAVALGCTLSDSARFHPAPAGPNFQTPTKPLGSAGRAASTARTRVGVAAGFTWLGALVQWWSVSLVVLAAALSSVLPSRLAIGEWITRCAQAFTSLLQYLRLGQGRGVAMGQLDSLLEHIAERDQSAPYRLHVVGYSLGSILAIDALFPDGSQSSRRLADVHTLVTIGCPFDLVRTYWPNYFQDRQQAGRAPQRWFNVYSKLDVFASNFRNDERAGAADQSVILAGGGVAMLPENVEYSQGSPAQRPTWLDELTLLFLRAHQMYWEPDYEGEVSCFGVVVRSLFENDSILA